MAFLQNIWWYLVLIGVMIMVHELGHYWVARFFDVKVETFSFGFGPRLFGFRRGETDFRFSAILFGGYVRMAGEQPGDEAVSDPRSFQSHPRWQRMCVVFAGPAINVVLAIALLTGLFMAEFPKTPTPKNPIVGYVAPNGAAAKAGIQEGDRVVQIGNSTEPTWDTILIKEIAGAREAIPVWVKRGEDRIKVTLTPSYDEKQGLGRAGWEQGEENVEIAGVREGMGAQKAGLQKGDLLISANGHRLWSTTRLNQVVRESEGQPVELVFIRKGEEHKVAVTPMKSNPDGKEERWMIGVDLDRHVEIVKLTFPQALRESVRWNVQNATLIFKFLEGLVERRMSPKSIEGPIRIAQMSGEAAREGLSTFVLLMAGVSLNLAIFNLLPIPILDGGQILLLFVEMLMRRDLDLRVREMVVRAGFVFLMVVVVFVIYNDISKILPPG
jgi:regulator of sigma E protease